MDRNWYPDLDNENHIKNADNKNRTGDTYKGATVFNELCLIVSGVAYNKLLEYEFYPKWMGNHNHSYSFAELEGLSTHLENEMREKMLNKDDKNQEVPDQGFYPIMCNNAVAFLLILQKQYDKGNTVLMESNRLIDLHLHKRGSSDKDYLYGLFYIVKGLQILLECHFKEKNFDYEGFILHELDDFHMLPFHSKLAVMFSRYFFIKLIRYRDIACGNLREMVSLDPGYFEWKLAEYCELRNQRLLRNQKFPTEDELNAIEMAFYLAPSHPFCNVYRAVAIAEHLQMQLSVQRKKSALEFRRFNFHTYDEAVNCIKSTCKTMTEKYPKCIELNLLVAEIMDEILPFKYRDSEFTKKCILHALKFGENSSKAHHYFAKYMLKHSKNQELSPLIWEPYLEKAVFLDKRNENALTELFLIYVGNPNQRLFNIFKLFELYINNYDITPYTLLKLLFIKGCLHFIVGEALEAFDQWLFVFNQENCENFFMMLRSMSVLYRLYNWDFEIINLGLIKKEVEQMAQTLQTLSEPTNDGGNCSTSQKKTEVAMKTCHFVKLAISSDCNQDCYT